jgi:plasmid stability protein
MSGSVIPQKSEAQQEMVVQPPAWCTAENPNLLDGVSELWIHERQARHGRMVAQEVVNIVNQMAAARPAGIRIAVTLAAQLDEVAQQMLTQHLHKDSLFGSNLTATFACGDGRTFVFETRPAH